MVKSAPALDAADRRILRALQRDGRLPVVALAEQVGLPLSAFVFVSLSSHAEEVVEPFHRAIALRPEVLACWAMSGETDYLLHVVAPDLDSYGEFALKMLLRLPGVKETRTAFVLSEIKAPGEVPV